MAASESNLYNVLKEKLGENEAQAIVQGIREEVKNEFENKRVLLSTKEDILNMKIEIEKGFKENLKWIIGAVIATGGIVFSLIKLM